MGRYYYGNISGKFWFAIQSSRDPENLGCSYNYFYEYVQCGCICNEKNISYCKSCYDSEEEHRKDIKVNKDSLIHKSNNIEWRIDISKKDFLLEKIKKIESIIDITQYISDINFDENDDYSYSIETTKLYDSADKKTEELLARWCLGKQILKCLEDKEYCNFYGEM